MERALNPIESEQIEDVKSELVEPVKRKGGRPFGAKTKQSKRWKEKEAKILSLATNPDITKAEIAKIVGCAPSVVTAKLRQFAPVFKNLDKINNYRDLKSDLLSASELTFLESSLDPEKLTKMNSLDGIKAFDIVNKANRLHNGLSTTNEAHRIMGTITMSPSNPPITEVKE